MSDLTNNRRRPTNFQVDWERIKNEYIFAPPIIDEETKSIRYPTLQEIADRNNVHINSITKKSAANQWGRQRAIYHQKVKALNELEVNAYALRRSAKFDNENIEKLDTMSALFDKWSANKEQAEEIDIRELKDAMDVVSKIHKLHRDIMGEPVNYYELYKEKLKEERKRVEKEASRQVSRGEIRDLIAAIKNKGEKGKMSPQVTLDVTPEEEENMRVVTDDRKEE